MKGHRGSRSVFLFALLVAGGWGPARGSPPSDPFDVFLEAASFPSPDGGAETRLTLQIPLRRLTGDSAEFHVRMVLDHDHPDAPRGGTWVYPPVPLGPGFGEGVFRHVYTYRLPAGRCRAAVRVEELGTERTGEATAGFEVPRYGEHDLDLSDLVIGEPNEGAGGMDRILPVPDRKFGEGRETLRALLAIRDRRSEDSTPRYRVRAAIRGRRGPGRERSLEVARVDGGGEVLVDERVDDLPAGEYRLELEVSFGAVTASAEGWFRVGESERSLGSEPERLRTVLGYIATHRERILLEEAPDDSLGTVWDRFWDLRDPTPATARNESEEDFLARVQEAGRRFGGLDPGWKTDMGRIYIRYGPPDRVERFPGEPYRTPSEVWTYTARGETFVFLDEGFGRYRLAVGR